MEKGLKSLTYTGVIWSFIERFSYQLIQFVISIIMARILDPGDYGLIGLLAIFMALSQVFIDGGFSSALIQSKENTDKDFATVFYINLAISILLYGLLFVSAPAIASFYHQPSLKQITRVYATTLIISSLSAVHSTKLVINVDFKTQSIISVSSAIISGCIGIFLAIKGFGVWALVFQSIVGTSIGCLMKYLLVRWIPKSGFSKSSFNRLFSFGSKLLIAQIISTIYDNIYSLFIGKRFSTRTLGFYTRGNQFNNLVSVNISDIMNRVSFPVLSRVQDDNTRLLEIYSKYIKMSVFIMFPMVLGLCGVAKPLITFLLTEKWLPCVPLLQILCFAFLFNGVTKINLNLLYVKGRSDLVLRLEIIKKCIGFTILVITVFFDIKIVCFGQVIYSWVALFLNTLYTKRILGFGFYEQIKSIIPYLSLSLIVLAESLAISSFVEPSWLSLIISLVVCSATYLGLSKYFSLYAFGEVFSTAKNYLIRMKHQ